MDYLLILRAVNAGTPHIVKMADLRDWLTATGLQHVETYRNSGNAFFTSPHSLTDCARLVADVLATHLDFPQPFGLFTREELINACAQAPSWWDGHGNRQHMLLFKLTTYAPGQDTWLMNQLTPIDHVVCTPRLIFWTVDSQRGFQRSFYRQLIGTSFYQQTSTRSYSTVQYFTQHFAK
ncbi:DUF1697 domain-containing protein [Levilactobacillus mulengensis]|uniref:DUF1697 domain-containing protein n=1 Tax=Levilactobacillus mulengensis TaxID=2486025 RepID=UPI000F769FF5|nr:DUF1697 domain-containing protein [Levilactobacillus mulengensis]